MKALGVNYPTTRGLKLAYNQIYAPQMKLASYWEKTLNTGHYNLNISVSELEHSEMVNGLVDDSQEKISHNFM